MVSTPTGEAINAVFRNEVGLICGSLVRMIGDFDLAEDLVQDAIVVALQRWPVEGVPDRPAAWLLQTARRRAKMERVEALLAEATDVSPLAPLIGAEDVAAAWEALPLGQRRAAVQALLTVTVQPAGRGYRPDVRHRVAFGPAQVPAVAA